MSGSVADTAELKRRAAEQAVEHVDSGMVVGLGTGSTAKFAVEAIGRKLQQGVLRDIIGIPTSRQTHELAESLGIPLTTLNDCPTVDVTIDGADEIDPSGNLIKGGGGALLWEKIVATASRKLCIVADESKLVDLLGASFPLPIEVVAFGWKTHEAALREMGARPTLRINPAGDPFVTDEGHYILDCGFKEGISDPIALDASAKGRPGVVETGLFLGMGPEVFVGRSQSH